MPSSNPSNFFMYQPPHQQQFYGNVAPGFPQGGFNRPGKMYPGMMQPGPMYNRFSGNKPIYGQYPQQM